MLEVAASAVLFFVPPVLGVIVGSMVAGLTGAAFGVLFGLLVGAGLALTVIQRR